MCGKGEKSVTWCEIPLKKGGITPGYKGYSTGYRRSRGQNVVPGEGDGIHTHTQQQKERMNEGKNHTQNRCRT